MTTADVFLSQLNMGSPFLERVASETRFWQEEDDFQFEASQDSSSALSSQNGPLSDPFLDASEDITTIRGSPFTYKTRSEEISPFQYGYTLGGVASPFPTTSPFGLGSPYKRRWGSESPVMRKADLSALASAVDLGTILGNMATGELKFPDGRVDFRGETPMPIRLSRKAFGANSPLTPVPPSGGAKRRKISIASASEEDEMTSPALSSPIRPRERSIRIQARQLSSTTKRQVSSPLSSPSRPPISRPATPPSPIRAMRQLPDGTQVTEGFPRWYRSFPKIKTGGVGGAGAEKNANVGLIGRKKNTGEEGSGEEGEAADLGEDDLYTPRWVKGRGTSKMGLCPVCGEEGKSKWFAMKFSAYNYHMQYAHGISAATNRPFDPPLKTRIGPPSPSSASTSSASSAKSQVKSTLLKRSSSSQSSSSSFSSSSGDKERKNLKPEHEKLYGLCGKCDTWVPVEGSKDAPMKVPEMVWWKHARGCGGRE